jgi:lactate permease
MLGAFTTGSNTNSNVLFGPLQLQMAQLLVLDRRWLLAAQTAGGALGSMVAPAKLVVGCATVGLIGQDGLVLRRTFAYALAIALVVGVVVLALA